MKDTFIEAFVGVAAVLAVTFIALFLIALALRKLGDDIAEGFSEEDPEDRDM